MDTATLCNGEEGVFIIYLYPWLYLATVAVFKDLSATTVVSGPLF